MRRLALTVAAVILLAGCRWEKNPEVWESIEDQIFLNKVDCTVGQQAPDGKTRIWCVSRKRRSEDTLVVVWDCTNPLDKRTLGCGIMYRENQRFQYMVRLFREPGSRIVYAHVVGGGGLGAVVEVGMLPK